MKRRKIQKVHVVSAGYPGTHKPIPMPSLLRLRCELKNMIPCLQPGGATLPWDKPTHLYEWIYFPGLTTVASMTVCTPDGRRLLASTELCFHQDYDRPYRDRFVERWNMIRKSVPEPIHQQIVEYEAGWEEKSGLFTLPSPVILMTTNPAIILSTKVCGVDTEEEAKAIMLRARTALLRMAIVGLALHQGKLTGFSPEEATEVTQDYGKN